MLGPDEDTRHHLAAAAAAGQQLLKPLIVAADAAVQTDAMSTESAGSTAAVAAADDQVEFMSPRHSMSKQQQQAAGAGDVWCEGAAGSALLSAARQEMQRLQELNQHLLESHAEGMMVLEHCSRSYVGPYCWVGKFLGHLLTLFLCVSSD